ncbi:threonine aldolase [Calidifontibacter sp. DB0510]|uniref:Threonine aldolase n=1 Tax=Metallococcus carri TaxID=1656884 RepID=A0A967AWT3_9MICO|nr:beta-eliminating lyase-related protein [Metallococcus carri]NHN54411.1 threonine aldolase [Metallococcus carri]NOP36750.1 threonine aldolase [Calidifontibacter sp. DB2511S]
MPSSTDSLDARFRAAQPFAERGFWRPRVGLADRLRSLARYAERQGDDLTSWDGYGERGPVAEVEKRVADLLGTEAAAYFPSGVMAQQVALRVWTERLGSRRVALPDLSHLIVHEEDGPRAVHDLDYVHLTTGPVTATAADLAKVPGELGAVLVELPLRDAGHLLPTWEELVALAAACRERGVPFHLDGARLWESAPHFARSLDEIAGLADSVYVSFYKGLGGLSGAALAGDADFVRESRLWRRRLGGTVWTAAPHALSALQGLDEVLPLMPRLHEFAQSLAEAFRASGLRVHPEQPHTNAFRLYLEGDRDGIRKKVVQALERDHVALPFGWQRADVPGWCFTEITVTPEILTETPADLVEQLITSIRRRSAFADIKRARGLSSREILDDLRGDRSG